MEKLEKVFTLNKFKYTQRERNDNYAIYLKENDVPMDNPAYFFCYEVIRIKKMKAVSFTKGGSPIEIPAKELYPNDKDWGVRGWTFKDFNSAEAEYITLAEKMPPAKTITPKMAS